MNKIKKQCNAQMDLHETSPKTFNFKKKLSCGHFKINVACVVSLKKKKGKTI